MSAYSSPPPSPTQVRTGLQTPLRQRIPFILAAFSTVVFCLFALLGTDLWNDEVWTLLLIRSRSFPGIARATALDVHPPLYYWLLKAVWTVFPGSVATAKLFSVLPLAAGLFVCVRRLCRERDVPGACLFVLLVLAARQLVAVSTEIRMYAWAAFFVLMAHFSGSDLVRTKKRRCSFALGVWSALSALTHYLAGLFAASVIGTAAIALWFLDRTDRKKTATRILLAGFVALVPFLPWAGVFLRNLSSVSGGRFWIPQAIGGLDACCHLFSLRPDWAGLIPAAAAVGLFAAGLACLVPGRTGPDRRDRAASLLFFAAPAAALILAILYSRLVSPILTRHYFSIPAMPVLFFLSAGLSRHCPKRILLGTLAAAAVFATVNLAFSAGGLARRTAAWNGLLRCVDAKASSETQFVYPGDGDYVLRALVSYLRPGNPHFSDMPDSPMDFHDPDADRRPLADADPGEPWCVVLRDGNESAWPAGFPEKGPFDLFRHSYWGSIRFYWSRDAVRNDP